MSGLVLGIPTLARAYRERVLATERANLLAYWPLDERTGATADNAEGTAARDGSHSGVALASAAHPQGTLAPVWDSTDHVNVFGTSLRDAFSPAAGTLLGWAKVEAAALTDGAEHVIVRLRVDANNFVELRKSTANNNYQPRYAAGGTTESVTVTATGLGWQCWAITWSVAADQVKVYLNGAQQGATQTGLGTWAGSLATTLCCIGAASTAGASAWSGSIAHVALWSAALSAAHLAALARP